MTVSEQWDAPCESNACPQVKWHSPCETNTCPEFGWDGSEGVWIRDSARPDEVVYLDRKGWDLLQTIKAPWE